MFKIVKNRSTGASSHWEHFSRHVCRPSPAVRVTKVFTFSRFMLQLQADQVRYRSGDPEHLFCLYALICQNGLFAHNMVARSLWARILPNTWHLPLYLPILCGPIFANVYKAFYSIFLLTFNVSILTSLIQFTFLRIMIFIL